MDIGIDPDLYYMLLNPVEMNNWIVQDSRAIDNMGVMQEERRRFARRGLGIEIPDSTIRPTVREIVAHARSIYQKHISR